MTAHRIAGTPADEAATPVRPSALPPRRRRRGGAGRVLLLAAAVLAGAVPAAAPEPATAAGGRPDGPLVPQSGFYVGAYTKHPDGYSADKQKSAILEMERDLGRRLHIDHHFYAWSNDFPSWRERWDLEHGRIPMISWNGNEVPTSQIAAGTQDGLIVSRAQAVRDLGAPVFLRWFWEMDGNKKAQYAENGDSYVRAWRRIVDIFRSQGATNAVWVWCPNASAVGSGEAMPYYPGDGYVDWVCGDGYNFAPNRPGDRWRNFEEIFGDFYAAAVKMNKPIMIGEFGVLEREPGEKGAWFHHAHDVMVERFPAIAAVVYFNADSTTNGVYFDWRVTTSPEAFEGFRYMFTGPAPVPKHQPPPSSPATSPPATSPPATARPAPPATRPPAPATPTRPRPAPTRPVPDAEPVPAAPPPPGPREPSARLAWVLQLLRQLDFASVSAAAGELGSS